MKQKWQIVLIASILPVLAVLAGVALAFSVQWHTDWNSSGDLAQWSEYNIGASGQQHSVSGGQVHMRARYGTERFGAYYRDNNNRPGTFPTDQDVRVMWRWRYPVWEFYGTQAGQVTSAYGVIQYYGVSALRHPGGDVDYSHVEANGPFGSWNVDRPMWKSSALDTSWHVSTFDFICDGQQMDWWIDGQRIHQATGSALPPGSPDRPFQFWFGNLLNGTPAAGDWTGFDIDYIYIYAVERPQMNTPPPGGGGTQAVSWQAVGQAPQPDGSSWPVQYQVRVCDDPSCGSVVATSGWQAGTSYTFSGLGIARTYYYQARAKWVGTPELTTCWSGTVAAEQPGLPALNLAKRATASAGPGEVIEYTLVVQNTGTGPASGVVVRDPLPQYVTGPANISAGGQVQGGEVVWNIGALAAGESRTLSWQGTLALDVPASVTEVVNTATAADGDGNSDQAQASTRVLVPGLAVAKTAPAAVEPGQVFSYTVTVSNTGNTTLSGVVVRDPLPQYVTGPANISAGGQVQDGVVVWDIGQISPGESLVLTWQGRVDPAVPVEVTEIVNTATVETNVLSGQAQATSQVLQPEMLVVKAGPETVKPGQVISYTIQVANRGNTTLYGVRVEDPLPAYVVPLTGGISNDGYEVPGRIVWDNLGDIPPGQTVEVRWQGQVDPLIPRTVGEIRNTALAVTTGGLSDQAEAVSQLLPAGLALEKSASATAWAGGEIGYILTVRNNGEGPARFVEVRDPVPAYTAFVPDVGPSINNYGTLEGSEVVWRLNELGPGEEAVLRWRAQVDVDVPAGVREIANRAWAVSLDTPEPVYAQASTQLLSPGLVVEYECPAFAGAGEEIAYRLSLANPTTGTSRQVVVRAAVPAGLAVVPGSVSQGGQVQGDEIVWDLGTLAAGSEMALDYRLALPEALSADVVSTARVSTADEPDRLRTCQTALVAPSLALTKTAPATALANETIEYVLTVENTGVVAARQVVLTDSLPAGADYVPGSASDGGALETDELVWQLGELAPGQRRQVHFEMVVHAPRGVSEAQLYNQAEASARGAVPVRATALTSVPRPVLHLSKSGPATVEPGGRIEYTLSGGNQGPGLARQAVLKDSLPEGVVLLEDTIGEGGYYDAATRQVVWPVGDLGPGAAVERRFAVLVPPSLWPGLGLENRAWLTSPDAAPAVAWVRTEITATFTVVGQKLASAYAEPGGQIDYALQVHNGSENLAANVVIRDPLPDYTTYITDTASIPPAFEEDGRTLVWSLGALAAGETREVRFRVQVADQVPEWLDRVTNVAAVSYSGGSFEVRATTLLPGAVLEAAGLTPTPAPTWTPQPTWTPVPPPVEPPPAATATPQPAGASPVVTVPPPPTPTPLPAPGLVKSVSPAQVEAGQVSTVTWRLVFANPTPLEVAGLEIEDPLPEGLAYVSSRTGQGMVEMTGSLSSGDAAVVLARVGSIPPGGQVWLEVTTQVLSDTAAGVYTNTAVYRALNLDPGRSNPAVLAVEEPEPVLLPVTGGLLDPRTPAGKAVWSGGLLAAVLGLAVKLGLGRFVRW